jgi:hypothetical protein
MVAHRNVTLPKLGLDRPAWVPDDAAVAARLQIAVRGSIPGEQDRRCGNNPPRISRGLIRVVDEHKGGSGSRSPP